ncbi:11532_t:CDS:2, partial [Racocetra fulgida]
MKAVPPGSSVLRSPLQFRKRPQKIVYEEDSLRRRFYRDHPYELLRPQSLIEKEIPVREDWSTLLGAERVAEEQALAFGAKRPLSQTERVLILEQENIKKCPPKVTV